jgi:CheY-like chemotaxis protein
MDIMMPKMNGIETLENLKNIVGFDMPVVALTADVISGMEDKYISQGFDDCLAKPIVEEELYYMLKKYLKESK